MSFEFVLSNDEIREKMFSFLKPVYRNTYDFDVAYINWIYGVSDKESGIFITYVKTGSDNSKYVVITKDGDIFSVEADRYRHNIKEIPDEYSYLTTALEVGIKYYNDHAAENGFKASIAKEDEEKLNAITENMRDRCRPAYEISCFEDAKRLLYKEKFNYHYISHMYNKHTVAQFNKYISEDKRKEIGSEEFTRLLTKITEYTAPLSEDMHKSISEDFSQAGHIFMQGTTGIFEKEVLSAVQHGFDLGLICVGYTGFIENYIETCIKFFPENINTLLPLLEFINKDMTGKEYGELEFYRKELEKRICGQTKGFAFVLTSKEIREKIYSHLKPEYRSVNDFDVVNINWTTGVYDSENGIFLTQIYYVSDGIARCGIDYYSYIVITDGGDIFTVTNNHLYDEKRYDFRIPPEFSSMSEKVKEGINFYGYSYLFSKTLSDETKEQLKIIRDEMDDRCRKRFSVVSEADARELWRRSNYNLRCIGNIYNKRTVEDFSKFATAENLFIWRSEEYLSVLIEIANGAAPTYNDGAAALQKFSNACNLFSRGVSEPYDEEFLSAVKKVYRAGFVPVRSETLIAGYIEDYLKKYPDKAKNLTPLIRYISLFASGQHLKNAVENVKNAL